MKFHASKWMGIAGVAAIAATAGGFGLAHAGSGSGNLMTAITPCRLVDTRSGIGPRSTPIGAGETLTFKATGDNGQCVGIDPTAQAVEIQLTSVGATATSYLTLFPSNLQTRPNVSQLNPQAGIGVVSNTTTVTLSPDGEFSLYNESGSSNIVIDVLGVFAPGANSAGLQGTVGTTGLVGPAGPVGPAGAAGAQGVPGEKGETGAAGAQGAPGEKGETGAAGAQGVPGEKGETGAAGAAGAKGDTGAAGAAGLAGVVIVNAASGSTDNAVTVTATCTGGKTVIGGGFNQVSGGSGVSTVTSSRPTSSTVWTVSAADSGTTNFVLQAYAICATAAS